MPKFNPLLDKKKPSVTALTASETIESSLVPLSPISQKPMISTFCRDTPVWADLENRLVIPHKK